MVFINLYFEHGIGEGLQYLALNLNFILFWHNILSLAAGQRSLLPAYIYNKHALCGSLRMSSRELYCSFDALESTKGQQCLLLQPTTNYSILSLECRGNFLFSKFFPLQVVALVTRSTTQTNKIHQTYIHVETPLPWL
jgi:hypothetical protein